jgi:hypothetical protein
MNRIVVFFLLLFVGDFAAAGMQQKEMPSMPKMDMQTMMKDCPMSLPGTSLATSDTAEGIAINFTTRAENVSELRRRVERMAAMHGGMASNQGMMKSEMLPGRAVYEPIEMGAQLTMTPKDPAKLGEFRDQVRTHVEQMKKSGCSMMQGPPKSEFKAEPNKNETDHSVHHPEGRP